MKDHRERKTKSLRTGTWGTAQRGRRRIKEGNSLVTISSYYNITDGKQGEVISFSICMLTNTYFECLSHAIALHMNSVRGLLYQIFQEETYREVTVEYIGCNFRRVVMNETKLEGI